MNRKNNRLSYMSDEEVQSMITDALSVLERTGIYLPNQAARDKMIAAGAKSDGPDRILIPIELTNNVLSNVGTRFKLYDQKGQDFLKIEHGCTYYGPGSDLRYVVDMETEKPRLTTMKDMAINISIIDSIPEYSFLMSTGLPHDIAPEEQYRNLFKAMVLNSDKPIVATAASLDDMVKIHEIAKIVTSGQKNFSERPFYMAYLEPVSPLKIEDDIARKIIFCAQNDIPIIFAAGANIAVQAPGSPETAVVQGTAESIAGLILAYQFNNNVKFMFGSNSAGFDEKQRIVSYGGPEWSKTMALYSEIASVLNLPVWGVGGCTDSNRLDWQAGMESMQSIMIAEFSRTTFAHDVGYLAHGDTTDPRAYLLNAEIIIRARWLNGKNPIVRNDSLDVIDDMSRGKIDTYLAAKDTFDRHCTRHHPEEWIDRFSPLDHNPDLMERTHDLVNRIINIRGIKESGEIESKRDSYEISPMSKDSEELVSNSLKDIFKKNIGSPEVLKEHLQNILDSGMDANDLYVDLVAALTTNLDEEKRLVFQLQYGEVFNHVRTVVEAKRTIHTQGEPLVIATVENDLHDVGKNLAGIFAGMYGYKVIDAGYDVKTGTIIRNLLENDSYFIGLSALLTTTRENMSKTIEALENVGMRNQVGVIIGGAVIDEPFRERIGADCYRRYAQEIAAGLDNIRDDLKDIYRKKNVDEVSIIGEHINSINPKVKKCLEEQDDRFLLELAEEQLNHGASYLGISAAMLSSSSSIKHTMQWAIRKIQANLEAMICIDTDDHTIARAALEAYNPDHGNAMLNSANSDEKRMHGMLALAKDYNTTIVFLVDHGEDCMEKYRASQYFIEQAEKYGIEQDRIFVDPGLQTMSANPKSPMQVLKTISMLNDDYPDLHYTVGLTNIGHGLVKPGELYKTHALQYAFALLGKRVGLDSVIGNVKLFKNIPDQKLFDDSIEFIANLQLEQGTENKIVYADRLEQ